MNKIKALLIAILATASLGMAQTALTTTTLTAARTCTGNGLAATCVNRLSLASVTNVTNPAPNGSQRTILYIDGAAYAVNSISGLTVAVTPGVYGTQGAQAHLSGATVYVGIERDAYFKSYIQQGACTATNIPILPFVYLPKGQAVTCVPVTTGLAGRFGAMKSFYVPPTQCTFAPTTLTQTTTFPQIGASNVMVVNSVTNAAAGTDTMTCNIWVPTNVSLGEGSFIVDVTAMVGSQTVAPTSVGTVTLGTISFPAAATVETPSTVTPVALGGTLTTTSPTAITTVTTAGSFLSIKTTPGTAIRLDNSLQLIQYTLPLLQSAASAMTVNSPGLIVHYVDGSNINQ